MPQPSLWLPTFFCSAWTEAGWAVIHFPQVKVLTINNFFFFSFPQIPEIVQVMRISPASQVTDCRKNARKAVC